MRSTAALSALAVAGTFTVAGSASASTFAVDPGGTVQFSARPSRAQTTSASPTSGSPTQTVVTDTGSTIAVTAGFVQVTARRATCPVPPNVVQNVAIDLADGNDFAHASSWNWGTWRSTAARAPTRSRTCLCPVKP